MTTKQPLTAEIVLNPHTNRIEQIGYIRGGKVLFVHHVSSFTEAMRDMARFAREIREEIEWKIVTA